MIIGNIIFSDTTKLKIPNYNIVTDFDLVNNDKPTLLIGYDKFKGEYELDFNDNKINDNLYWTFNKSEDRASFNNDLYEFMLLCEGKIFVNFKYKYIDPFNINFKKIKKLITFFNENKGAVGIIDKTMLFIDCDNKTFGFNLEAISVCGVNYNKIDKLLHKFDVDLIGINEKNIISEEVGDITYDSAHIPFLTKIIT